MTKRSLIAAAGMFTLLCLGCQSKEMSMEEMMKPPPRAAELDMLNMWVGEWEGEMRMTMPGSDEVLTGTGTSKSHWAVDNRAVVEEFGGTMGEEGKYSGYAIWTWDEKAERFRGYMVDNHGMQGTMTARYDEETKTWHFKGKSSGPHGSSVSEGTATMVDDNTMTWEHTEWDGLKLVKYMEMTGTSRRK